LNALGSDPLSTASLSGLDLVCRASHKKGINSQQKVVIGWIENNNSRRSLRAGVSCSWARWDRHQGRHARNHADGLVRFAVVAIRQTGSAGPVVCSWVGTSYPETFPFASSSTETDETVRCRCSGLWQGPTANALCALTRIAVGGITASPEKGYNDARETQK
jgi:hypothetical protein